MYSVSCFQSHTTQQWERRVPSILLCTCTCMCKFSQRDKARNTTTPETAIPHSQIRWLRWNANPQHTAYCADALPAELPRQLSCRPNLYSRDVSPLSHRVTRRMSSNCHVPVEGSTGGQRTPSACALTSAALSWRGSETPAQRAGRGQRAWPGRW